MKLWKGKKRWEISISHNSANHMLEKISVKDDTDAAFIGVDNVSLRKGQTYHTVIYDGSDHHLLALLDGKDGETLKEHPKVSVVARDKKRAAGRLRRYERIMQMRKDWDDGKYDSKSSLAQAYGMSAANARRYLNMPEASPPL